MTGDAAWNSLEVVKLLVSLLTPIAVAVLGIVVGRASKRAEVAAAEAAHAAEDAQWANRRAVERLIEIHKEMAPLLNDLLCFFRLIGHFRSIDPPELLLRKRKLDRLFFTNEHLFGESFQLKYQTFMKECFSHWTAPGEDALIRASRELQRDERGAASTWLDEWNQLFIEEPDDARQLTKAQQLAYNDVMRTFATEIGIRSLADRPAGP